MKNWEKNVRRVIPYVPGEQPNQPDMIKLNTNENPYPPSPNVQAALEAMEIDELRRYPDSTCHVLVKALADYYGLKEDQVFTGVGSDDVLALIFMTFFNGDKPVLFPDITYSFYDVWANVFRIPFQTVSLDENFEIDPNDYAIPNGGIVMPNPNAPTGVELPLHALREVLEQNRDVVVIIDEAYVDFGAHSALPLIEEYDNLLVVQTFSKSRSMAGVRIGYAMGDAKLIRYLNDVKYSFNSYTMNLPALQLGAAAITDDSYFKATLQQIIETREWTKQELKKLGFVFQDSKANFVFAAHQERPAEEIYQALRRARIYVRYFNKPRIDNYLRITIGTAEEMQALINFLTDYLKG